MQNIRRQVDRLLARGLIGLMGVAVVNVLWQVFTRWILDDPSSYTEELARFLLIWIGLLGAAYAAGRRLHLAIDLLPAKLTGRPRRLLDMAIEALVAAFALGVMVVGGGRLVWLMLRLDQTSAALQVPLGYVYVAVPLAGLLILFYALLDLAGHVRALRAAPAGG